jgi:site-specific recombinase XerD
MDTLFKRSNVVEHLSQGPFGPCIAQLDRWVLKQKTDGYKLVTIRQAVRLVDQLGDWMLREGVDGGALNADVIAEFLRTEDRWARRRGSESTADRLLKYLEDEGVVAPRVVSRLTEPHTIVDGFRQHLLEERGLAPVTLLNILPTVRQFLVESSCTDSSPLTVLTAASVTTFVRRHSARLSIVRAKLMVGALRAFLRYLRQRGEISLDLAACVPTVADWRLAGLPRFLEPEQVELLLSCCDRGSSVGCRDYAILILLARLGLRACEVVSLRLDDIDWQVGEVTVCGKDSRMARLPLVCEVGEAIVEYLKHGRPDCGTRHLFVRARAPYRGFSNSVAICDVMRRALARAGLNPPHKGAHVLRHSVAVRMLRHGASLHEIGQLLRHCHPQTTAIYAKVDLDSLRALAQPWPGGVE